jgi:DNA-binding transcriptional LysR family regulator
MEELSLDDLAVFVRVVERGGFAAAARELRVPTSTVSRAIERLEARAEARLLHRTTRSVRPTSEGRELFTSVASPVAALRSAARSVEPVTRQPTGRLRVSVPGDLFATFLAEVMVAFAERYPLVGLDFKLTNEPSDLVNEGLDVALRAAARLPDSSLVVRKLGQLEHRLYASPDYLRKHGAPKSIAELSSHRCIVFRGVELTRTWRLRNSRGDVDVKIRGAMGGDDFAFVRAAAIAGGGIGLLPHLLGSTDEANERLVRVLPELSARGATLYIVYPSAKKVPLRVTAFRDFVVEAFERWRAQHP